MPEEDTGGGVDVRMWVLGLSVLDQNLWSNLRVGLDELEDWVGSDLGAGGGKLHESIEAGIWLAEHSVAVTWNDLATVEGGPEELLDRGVVDGALERILHLEDEAEDFLGGETVERSSKTLETGRVGEERIGEGGSNEMCGVGRDIASLMITMEGEVETEEISESLILWLAEHDGEVLGPIEVAVDGWESTTWAVGLVVDLSGDSWELGEEGDGIFEDWLPVLGLVETVLVGLCEDGVVVESRDTGGEKHVRLLSLMGNNGRNLEGGNLRNGELGHWVESLWEVLHHLFNEWWESSLVGELSRENADLLSGWDLTSKEEPEHGFWQHLGSGLSLWKNLLAILDGLSVETNTLFGVENGSLPEHSLDSSVGTLLLAFALYFLFFFWCSSLVFFVSSLVG